MCINEIHDELLACHADIPWTETRPRPRLTQQGDRALEAIARAITENVVNLDARDVAGVCTMAIELLEQLEDDAARSLAPPPFQDSTAASLIGSVHQALSGRPER